MANLSHGSTIRRPAHPGYPTEQEEDAAIYPNEALLDEFYDESRQSIHLRGSSARKRSNVNPLFEEIDDSDHGNNNNAFAFRRRRIDDNDKSHPQRNDGYNSVDNDEVGSQDSRYYNDMKQPQKSTSDKAQQHLTWNKLNATLFVGQALLTFATTAPITLVPTMALSLAGTNDNEEWNYAPYYNLETLEVYDESGTKKRWIPFRIRTSRKSNNNNNNDQSINSSSIFASHLTSVVTLVTAFGKFINGAFLDIAGARRLLVLYGICTCVSLIGLSFSTTTNAAIACCASVEFFSSVNWSAGIVILGAHYGMNGDESNGRFERGLYVTSLACRCGSLLAIPLSSLLIKWTDLTWRGVAGLAACAALGGVVVFYFHLTDSPGKVHDPQNPIRTTPLQSSTDNGAAHRPYHPSHHSWSTPQPSMSRRAINLCSSVVYTVLPSIRAILVSRVFWAVAAAHAGATMVMSSQRVLGTYFRDTSFGAVTESKAGAMTVFLSLGMLGGLLVGGKAFARAADSEQGRHIHPHNVEMNRNGQSSLIDATQLGTKNMIAFFYCLSICMCYMLSFLAMPFVRRALHLPVLVLILQALATLGLGFGVAVQYYHIPAIVGATFGKNRGLYTSYTDGVAALVSSIVWRIVGGAVEEGNPQGGGWVYGWAAVALLLVVCGTLMVKIIEMYFVGGGWRHDTPKDHVENSFPMELPTKDMNSSWMEDEIRSTGFSVESSPLRKPGSLTILSTSALEFIGTPGRSNGKRLASIDSRGEVDTSVGDNANIDLLGIDDDGSLLFPSSNAGPQQDIRTQDDFVSFNSVLESKTKKEIRDNDSCIRESSVFDDPYSDPC
eukprot:CAMPEP_0201942976 /NCGR_PEP_ID=MMETSP0903-20130614/50101_1 /ASSEMBLY_ACC=CAM_ASM_000552 /TAXON_ID=420261 /ORGANISM="Thalassiosira antarctica, Strain CCMP982" /LENGTH=834 /DNA_ID=CAMNT_0048485529 /DNA_START=115 /DNA_END=2616 /DNA_ORIENTATION=-